MEAPRPDGREFDGTKETVISESTAEKILNAIFEFTDLEERRVASADEKKEFKDRLDQELSQLPTKEDVNETVGIVADRLSYSHGDDIYEPMDVDAWEGDSYLATLQTAANQRRAEIDAPKDEWDIVQARIKEYQEEWENGNSRPLIQFVKDSERLKEMAQSFPQPNRLIKYIEDAVADASNILAQAVETGEMKPESPLMPKKEAKAYTKEHVADLKDVRDEFVGKRHERVVKGKKDAIAVSEHITAVDAYSDALIQKAETILSQLEADGKEANAAEVMATLLASERLQRSRATVEAAEKDTKDNKLTRAAKKFLKAYTTNRKVRLATTVALAGVGLATGGTAAVVGLGAIKAGLRGATGYSAARTFQQNRSKESDIHARHEQVTSEKDAAYTGLIDRIRDELGKLNPENKAEFMAASLGYIRAELDRHLAQEEQRIDADRRLARRQKFIALGVGAVMAGLPFAAHGIAEALHHGADHAANLDKGGGKPENMPGHRYGPRLHARNLHRPLHGYTATAHSGDSIWTGREAAVDHYLKEIHHNGRIPGLSSNEWKQYKDLSPADRNQLQLIITDRLKDISLANRGGNSLVHVGDKITTNPEQFTHALKYSLKQMRS